MAFVKDYGQCCLVLPLKLGVGLIAMLVFANACLCVLAVTVQDIRFQPNGYDPNFMYLPSAVGTFGLVFGFVGLLGVYDDKPGWVRVFLIFMLVNLLAKAIAMVADFVKLMQCDNWFQTHAPGDNAAMEVLHNAGVCFYSRWAYGIGSGLDFLFWVYCAHRVWVLKSQIDYGTAYPIDFGRESYDIEARWRLFQVKDPSADINYSAQLRKKFIDKKNKQMEDAEARAAGLPTSTYGSIEEAQPGPAKETTYGPDGMPVDVQM